MTEFMQSMLGRAGSVDFTPTAPRKPKIKKIKFSKIVLTLYSAFIHRKGIYGQVSMETHAPQLKYYPGCQAVLPIGRAVENVNPLMQMLDESLYEVELSKKQTEALRLAFARQVPAIELERERRVVPRMTLEHRRWLWFATLTDRREKSDLVYRAHCRIYEDYPELYDRRAIDIDPDDFREMIRRKSYKIGSPYQSAEYWLVCLKTLFEEFDGDPVKLLKTAGWSVRSVYAWKETEKKKRGYDPIPGWGRKLISLYFLYLAELGYPMPDDVFPADVHAQAILVQTGCLDFAGKDKVYTAAVAEMLREEVTRICNDRKYDVILYGHASWLLGSQLCVNCAGNDNVPILCPIYEECKGRVDTSPYFAKGIWRKSGQVMVKGGIRPPFGLPTDVLRRERTRKKTQAVIPITPLFDR